MVCLPYFIELIEAVRDRGSNNLIDYVSSSIMKNLANTIKQVHLFFMKIMLGLPGKPINMQNAWWIALINFLQD